MPVKIHGKDYYTVAERIQTLNDTYKDKYSINTELLKCSDSVIIMKATLTFHLGADDVRTFVGHAMEEIGSSKINELSALECAETSAIGRSISAAGMAGSAPHMAIASTTFAAAIGMGAAGGVSTFVGISLLGIGTTIQKNFNITGNIGFSS